MFASMVKELTKIGVSPFIHIRMIKLLTIYLIGPVMPYFEISDCLLPSFEEARVPPMESGKREGKNNLAT